MISQKLRTIEALLTRKMNGEAVSSSEIVATLHDLYQDIRQDFSVFSMLLYHRHRLTFLESCGGSLKMRAPSFFEGSYLDDQFTLDPSRYDIVLALAIKTLEAGDQVRAKQLFERVARSRYREHELAGKYLAGLRDTAPAAS